MSLDVYLEGAAPSKDGSGIFLRRNGMVVEISREEWDRTFPGQEPVVAASGSECFHANITHNLGKMANAAGIYNALWRPDENGIECAWQLVAPLTAGLNRLRSNPEQFKAFNPPNGWGDYDSLVSFVETYLDACKSNPIATVRVWR